MNKNEVKKDLYKSKVNAKFSHYTSGNLYYNVELIDGVYQFPISTIEVGPTINTDYSELSMYETETIKLSSDLGTTDFSNEMKGSDLNRWISKAIDNNEFIKIK
jgi:hypothetical protein